MNRPDRHEQNLFTNIFAQNSNLDILVHRGGTYFNKPFIKMYDSVLYYVMQW